MLHALRRASRPVVFFGNGIGDHLLVLPALRALAQHFDGRLTLVAPMGARERYFADLPLRTSIAVQLRHQSGWFFDPLIEALGDWDLTLWLNPWSSPLIDRLHTAAPHVTTVGLGDQFDHCIDLDYTKHASDLAFDVPRALFGALRLEDFAQPPALACEAFECARRVRAAVGPGKQFLVVHVDTGEEKRWPVNAFRQVMDRLLDSDPNLLVLLVGSEDQGLEAGPHCNRIVSLLGWSLPASMAVVGDADAFLGIDSCFLHAADFFRTPGVGLFSPTSAFEFGFRLDGPYVHLEGKTMHDIDVDSVVSATQAMLQLRRRGIAAGPFSSDQKVERRALFCTEEWRSIDGSSGIRGRVKREWTVQRLWNAAAELEPEAAAVDDFDLDQVHWWEEHERPTVGNVLSHFRRMKRADLGYPIILSETGRVMDGFHRLARAVLEQRVSLPAVRFTADPEPCQIKIERCQTTGRG